MAEYGSDSSLVAMKKNNQQIAKRENHLNKLNRKISTCKGLSFNSNKLRQQRS